MKSANIFFLLADHKHEIGPFDRVQGKLCFFNLPFFVFTNNQELTTINHIIGFELALFFRRLKALNFS